MDQLEKNGLHSENQICHCHVFCVLWKALMTMNSTFAYALQFVIFLKMFSYEFLFQKIINL